MALAVQGSGGSELARERVGCVTPSAGVRKSGEETASPPTKPRYVPRMSPGDHRRVAVTSRVEWSGDDDNNWKKPRQTQRQTGKIKA